MARTGGNIKYLWDYIFKPWGRLFRQPAFLLCTVLLGISAAGLRAGERWLEWNFRKEEIPLRKGLGELDRSKLGSYNVIEERKFPKEIEEELGTKEYINWVLEDTSVDSKDPARYLRLHVSYYTGNPDKVPHIPEICFAVSGALVRNRQNTEIRVPNCGQEQQDDKIPIRVMDIWFPQSQVSQGKGIVGYFFAVNGEYRCTNIEVRFKLNNWWERYAYFSKVEISFLGQRELTQESALAAMEKLGRTVTPILWSEHWPDWSSWSNED